jgi:dCMP deaminase
MKTLKWDIRFLQMARLVSTFSKDPSTQTGAVIVRPDRTVCSVGFNGFPMDMPDKPEWYNDREEKYSRIIHCEMNALLHAREPVKGYTLYNWAAACCDRCVVHMVQAGIKTFVNPLPTEDMLSRWGPAFEKTKRYIADCGAVSREYLRIGELA